MQRLWTKNATGVPPDGRWYAGDVNLFQDTVAALSDFTQTLGALAYSIGDGTIQLLKYATGEARLTGALRTDGIVRALGGLYAGAFTTAERDAILAGKRPYGLVILNKTTNRYEWNQGSDATPNWQPFGSSGSIGNLGAIPAANSVPAGTSYFAVDQVVDYISDGASWIRKSDPAGITVSWYSAAAAPAGWFKYDSGNLPSGTGIYADLATHLGGLATPDTRGRVEVAVGAHADVSAPLGNDGLAVALRRIKHKHTVNDPGHNHPGGAAPPAAGQAGGGGAAEVNAQQSTSNAYTGITVGPQTGNEPTDGPAWINVVKIAKL